MDIKELIGVTLGTCTLERIIGRGGMGAVFLAQQKRPIRTVAVKVLLPADGIDPDEQRIFLARFRREADTVAKLEHKNILPIYEYDEDIFDGQRLAYLVMPFIRGGTLRERIDEMKRSRRQFDLDTIVNYVSQVADALNYAHSLGIVHRDIKPGNLLFHSDGRLLLSDFGIVRLQAMPALTTVGSFLGTAEYSSPEQISAGELDARSDIYSLGIILYELLTGNAPFTGPNPFVVMSKQLHDPVPSLRATRPDIPPAVEFVVRKALAKKPEDRYQRATEMAEALRAAASSSTPSLQGLRLTGDANNIEETMPERPPMSWPRPAPSTGGSSANIFPPTRPAIPIQPSGSIPSASAFNAALQYQGQAPSVGVLNNVPPVQQAIPEVKHTTDEATQRQGRRLFYYGVALAAVPLELLVFLLLFSPIQIGSESPAILGILLGTGVNLLALAAIVLTGVTRQRYRQGRCRKFFYNCLGAAILVPIASGFFINFGTEKGGLHIPLLAFIILLLSNVFVIRQLGRVDARGEQIETAPILWRPAIIGALTGLLPLTLILIFALSTPTVARIAANPPLFRLIGILLLTFLGSTTPGAMLAVASATLQQKKTFPTLVRSSALAGLFLFLAAFLLTVAWSLPASNHILIFYHFSQPGIALLVGAILLGLIGTLRGILDAWIYQRFTRKRSDNI